MAFSSIQSTPKSTLLKMPHEIMENIFDQLANKGLRVYEPEVKKALLSCLYLSKYLREFAALRLFRCMEFDTLKLPSLSRLNLLLKIMVPSPSSLEWMSILSYTRQFQLMDECPGRSRVNLLGINASKSRATSTNLLPLLYALAGTNAHQLKSLVLRLSACHFQGCPHFTKEFKSAVANLLKKPSLKSVEINGAGFLPSTFLDGTHFRHLSIFKYDPDSYIDNPDTIMTSGTDVEQNVPLSRLTTDITFPVMVGGPSAGFIQKVNHLEVRMVDECDCHNKKLEHLVQLSRSLKVLALHFDELYPITNFLGWTMNFGELEVLETLEVFADSSYLDADMGSIIQAGERSLTLLFQVLDTIHGPLRRLTKLKWAYVSWTPSGPQELPFLLLDSWLWKDIQWETLDRRLTSAIYPALTSVELLFCISNFRLYQADGDTLQRNENLELECATRMQSTREAVFPRLVTSLRENFKIVVE